MFNKKSEEENDERTREPAHTGGFDDVTVREIKGSLAIIQANIILIQKLLGGNETIDDVSETVLAGRGRVNVASPSSEGAPRVIEGVFDGQMMIGPDGQKYQVPPNYASKSKLVEGDILKLTITKTGSFIYKQIAPIDRERVVGELIQDDITGDFRVKVGDKTYRMLQASVTYFKGDAGDEAVVLVPKNTESTWAALENILKRE